MISLFIFAVTFALSSLVFVIREKKTAFALSMVTIALNAYFLFKRGLFEEFYVVSSIGYFGFTVNDLNFAFLVTILVVSLSSAVYSLRYMEERFEELGGNWGLYFGLFDLFAISMIYVVLSVNLLELYIFLEVALITSFLLIMLYGYGDRRRISLLYFIWTHVGTILMLASIIVIGVVTGKMDIYSSYGTFEDYSSVSYALLLFLLGVVGMMMKSAQAGFNIWLPYAHGEAPTPVSALLSPNTVGLGVFVVILYFYLFPSFSYLAGVFIGWALITMIYGGVNAIAQKDFKRFLAYSSVSQMGYMLLGASIAYLMGLGSSADVLPLGVLASVLIYASHGFGKAILFMSAGASITELKERNIYNLGGLYSSSPLHSTLAFIGMLNILGLPPSLGLISEALLLFSSGELARALGTAWVIVALAVFVGIGISSAYMTYLYKRVYGGTSQRKSIDGVVEYSLPMAILALVSVITFFFPQYLTASLNDFLALLQSSGDFYLFLIVFAPALGSLIALVTPKSLNQDVRGSIVVLSIGVSMVLSYLNLASAVQLNRVFYVPTQYYQLFGYLQFSSSLLQAILAAFVSTLSFFIALYSIGYMKEDNVLRRYWGFFGFFVSSMLAVVLSDNALLFLAGWEGTSLASYGLIGYWLDDNDRNVVGDFGRKVIGVEYLSRPTTSAIRAMIFTRVGDVGLFLGLGYLVYLTTNSVFYGNTLLYEGVLPYLHLFSVLPLGLVLLVFTYLGGLSKSAQFPFTQWLVTAMTGPTPVSALIHAATMVNLGAIFTFITYPYLVPGGNGVTVTFLSLVAGIAIFTAAYTSLNALVSNEQKVILANSTADQISLMIFSSSMGALLSLVYGNPLFLYAGIGIGLVQMVAHGIYKASLFMNVGSVIHATETRYVGEYPNLYRKLKGVFALQTLAAFNLANVPPLIGFWAHSFISSLTSGYLSYLYVALEFLGSVYIIRYLAKTFLWGKGEKELEGHVSKVMLVSPLVLVLASIGLGALIPQVAAFFSKELLVPSFVFHFDVVDLVASLVGIFIAFAVFTGNADFARYSALRPLIDFLYYGWYVYPLFDLWGATSFKFYNAVFKYVETGVIDQGLNVKLPAGVLKYGAVAFSKIQTGVLRDYLAYYVGGVVLLVLIFLIILGVV
ncbi:MAG: NADH dehydrogenase (quinone) [Candidatus Aramenus sulfurataquae]|jgi:NADH-quinone oxidoreductase subunit L/M|uniref:NADH dehydrogenase (Quinone) n=4 Tax=Candidatus Aramenus sulfurataquae TaxID=1326980 RepID=W7KX12_9CREN|nr:MAG: NADH dehydrogenase (quinone) [Candidatus Aramenus sulfurataquae]MCL7344189.1 oxidoreductase [Candidatus Aramenus sulfurataquae]